MPEDSSRGGGRTFVNDSWVGKCMKWEMGEGIEMRHRQNQHTPIIHPLYRGEGSRTTK